MSVDPNRPTDSADIKREPPTPKQLAEFQTLVERRISQARFPHTIEDSVGMWYINKHGGRTSVGIGRGVLFTPDAVDTYIQREIKKANGSGISVKKDETYAFSPSTGAVHFSEQLSGFLNGVRLKSDDEQMGQELLLADPNESFWLALDEEALDAAEGPLADYIRELIRRKAANPEDRELTRYRLEIALEELRSLRPEDEEIPELDFNRILPELFADMIEDEHMDGEPEN